MYYNRSKLEETFSLDEWISFFELKNLIFFYKVSEVINSGEIEYVVNIKSKKDKEIFFVGYSNTIKFSGKKTNEDFIMYVYLLFESIIESHFNVSKSLSRIVSSYGITGDVDHFNKIILTNLRMAGYFQGHKNNLYILDNELFISFEEFKFNGSVIVFKLKYDKKSLVFNKESFICNKSDNLYDTNILAGYLVNNNILNINDKLLLKLLSE